MNYTIRNWKRFQHYKDRCPPWIKLHWEVLSSRDWVMLADDSRVLMVACMLIASRNEGVLPGDPEYIKRVAYLNKKPNFEPLIKAGFLEPQADASGRKRMLANDTTETETETEEEYSSEPDKPTTEPAVVELPLIPRDGTYPVTQSQLDEWQNAYPGIDVLQEVKKSIVWCQANPSRKKTTNGACKFLVGWLNRAQNSSSGKRGMTPGQVYQEDTDCPL